jgi:stage V sporulation protein SpoVS
VRRSGGGLGSQVRRDQAVEAVAVGDGLVLVDALAVGRPFIGEGQRGQ